MIPDALTSSHLRFQLDPSSNQAHIADHPTSTQLTCQLHPTSTRTQLRSSSLTHHGYNNATPATQVPQARSGTGSRLRACARPPANFAHQEDERFEPFPCLAQNAGADSLRCQRRRWPSGHMQSQCTIPDSRLQHWASHPTCEREHALLLFGLPAPFLYCKSQYIMHSARLAAGTEPHKNQTSCAQTHIHNIRKPMFRIRAPFGAL